VTLARRLVTILAMRLTWIVAVALSACGGKVAGEAGSAGADAESADGVECVWADAGSEQETCSKGAYRVTIDCGGALDCQSPSKSFMKLVQGDYCGNQVAAYMECGFP
jgi:hypothetical protein